MATLDRDKALDMALAQIDKQFGKGSVMRLGDSPEVAMKVIPTGSIALDIALGIGGLPRGRVIAGHKDRGIIRKPARVHHHFVRHGVEHLHQPGLWQFALQLLDE